LEYLPDGKKLLSATAFDNLTTVWDAETGERLYVLAEGTVFPNGLAISQDGSMVTVGMDRIYTYLLDMEQLAALGQERLTRSFALDECQKYLHLDQCP
jgi:sugar lactone lactonase YvrE